MRPHRVYIKPTSLIWMGRICLNTNFYVYTRSWNWILLSNHLKYYMARLFKITGHFQVPKALKTRYEYALWSQRNLTQCWESDGFPRNQLGTETGDWQMTDIPRATVNRTIWRCRMVRFWKDMLLVLNIRRKWNTYFMMGYLKMQICKKSANSVYGKQTWYFSASWFTP